MPRRKRADDATGRSPSRSAPVRGASGSFNLNVEIVDYASRVVVSEQVEPPPMLHER
jgi:hypothetical protein